MRKTKELKKRYRVWWNKCIVKAKKLVPNKTKVSKTIKRARVIIEKLHNIPRIGVYTRDVCNFCDLLTDYLEERYTNPPIATIVAVLAGLLYLVNPFDAIPDWILGLGWIDDAAVIAFVVSAEQNDVNEYLKWKERYIAETGKKSEQLVK